jgi:dTMP kinase
MSGSRGFISFEGIEGSGKSTQAKRLAGYFRAKGRDVIETVEPGGTGIGDKIRTLLLEPGSHMDSLTELLLYYSSRAQHVKEVIYPALRENKVVITDRFTDSTLAYQGYARGVDMTVINKLNDIVVPHLEPFVTFLLDLDVEEGLRRNRRANKEDRFELETVAFHKRVRSGFLEIARKDPDRVKIVDASKGPDEVNGEIVRIIEEVWH